MTNSFYMISLYNQNFFHHWVPQAVSLSTCKQQQLLPSHFAYVFVGFGALTNRCSRLDLWADNQALRPALLDNRPPFMTSLLNTLQRGFPLQILDFKEAT